MPLTAVAIVIVAGIIFYKQEPSQRHHTRPSAQIEVRRAPAPGHPGVEISGEASVLDGDTIDISGMRIRMFGIDAPENDQPCSIGNRTWACGTMSTASLRDLIGDSPVRCAPTGKDRYGRTLARCHVREIDIQSWMVAHGWAVAYSRYSRDYEAEQQQAQSHRLGIWQGDVDLPEEWRRLRQRR